MILFSHRLCLLYTGILFYKVEDCEMVLSCNLLRLLVPMAFDLPLCSFIFHFFYIIVLLCYSFFKLELWERNVTCYRKGDQTI